MAVAAVLDVAVTRSESLRCVHNRPNGATAKALTANGVTRAAVAVWYRDVAKGYHSFYQ